MSTAPSRRDATGRRRQPWQMPRDGAGRAGVIHIVFEELDGLATALLGHLDAADAAGRRLRALERDLDPDRIHLVSRSSERTLHRILADLTGPTGVARLGRALASDVEFVVRARTDAAHADRSEARAYVRRLTGRSPAKSSLRGRLADDLLAGLAAAPGPRRAADTAGPKRPGGTAGPRHLPTTPNGTGGAPAPRAAAPATPRWGPVRVPARLVRPGTGAGVHHAATV